MSLHETHRSSRRAPSATNTKISFATAATLLLKPVPETVTDQVTLFDVITGPTSPFKSCDSSGCQQPADRWPHHARHSTPSRGPGLPRRNADLKEVAPIP
jgi:hypothetical protein